MMVDNQRVTAAPPRAVETADRVRSATLVTSNQYLNKLSLKP